MNANAQQVVNNNIETLDEMISRLQDIRSKVGKNLPITVSVLQETEGQPFGTYFEDRQLSKDIIHVKNLDVEFVELYI